jgi:hypothetical protein
MTAKNAKIAKSQRRLRLGATLARLGVLGALGGSN